VNSCYVPSPIQVRGLSIFDLCQYGCESKLRRRFASNHVGVAEMHNVGPSTGGAPLPDYTMLTLARFIQIVMRAVHEAFRTFSAEHLLPVLANAHREATAWRDVPDGSVEIMPADLQPASRASYLRALTSFDTWCRSHHRRPLVTAHDLDVAAYTHFAQCNRSQAESLSSALYRAYPPLRRLFPWASSRLRTIAGQQPPRHHVPLPWFLLLHLAAVQCRWRRPRRAGLYVLAWKFGLRPAEVINLRGGDLYGRRRLATSTGTPFIRVGALRPTKAGPPQVVRAPPWDPVACWIVELFAETIPSTARLSDLSDYRALNLNFRSRCRRGAAARGPSLPEGISPHSWRAGWASWRHSPGQQFADLREDGGWRSDGALRIYLDMVTALDLLEDPRVMARMSWLRKLDET